MPGWASAKREKQTPGHAPIGDSACRGPGYPRRLERCRARRGINSATGSAVALCKFVGRQVFAIDLEGCDFTEFAVETAANPQRTGACLVRDAGVVFARPGDAAGDRAIFTDRRSKGGGVIGVACCIYRGCSGKANATASAGDDRNLASETLGEVNSGLLHCVSLVSRWE